MITPSCLPTLAPARAGQPLNIEGNKLDNSAKDAVRKAAKGYSGRLDL